MHLPRFMRRVNRVFTNPLLGSLAWFLPPLAVVHHVGGRNGRGYRTPVVAFPPAAGFILPVADGGDVDWGSHLVQAPGGELPRLGQAVTGRNPRGVGGAPAYF